MTPLPKPTVGVPAPWLGGLHQTPFAVAVPLREVSMMKCLPLVSVEICCP